MTLSVALRHHFAGFQLDVAFDAPPGVTALFGRSGSGKTTVVNAVAGLLRPDDGRIAAGDTVLLDTGRGLSMPPHRRRIGYVFQDARLFPHLSVRQNLLYGRWFARRGAGAEFEQIVDLLGVGALLHRRPGALSGGERQRVALGRAILSNPRLLLMDEPLAALDEARKAEILPYLERLRDRLGLPILYVSHSPAEVARLATTVVMLESGRVRAAGPAAQVLADPQIAPGFGRHEAGAIVTATLAGTEPDGLARIETAAGPLWLPAVAAPAGSLLRLRVLARDVMLATTRPEGLSALNILPVTVTGLAADGDSDMLVSVALGDQPLLARITRRSVGRLGLAPGQAVFALLKSVALAGEAIGQIDPKPPGT